MSRTFEHWLILQALAWGGALLAGAVVGPRPWMLLVAAAAATLSWGTLWGATGAGRRPADVVTAARFAAMVAVLVAAWIQVEDHAGSSGLAWGAWILLAVAAGGDLLDGWIARRLGGSPGGALLDMETDQLMVTGMAILLWQVGGVGPWILAAPGIKHAAVLARVVHGRLPSGQGHGAARWICALVVTLLLAGLAPDLGPEVRNVAALLALAALAVSFSAEAWMETAAASRPGVRR